MVQHTFSGPSAQDFLMSLTPSSLGNLSPFSSTLSVLLNEEGGIIDDTVITKHADDSFYVVTNAGRAAEDKAHFEAKLKEWNGKVGADKQVKWEIMDGWGLVALQGPTAAQALQGLTKADLTAVKFGQSVFADVDGVRCHIARGGYTGEDGFEVSRQSSRTLHRLKHRCSDLIDLHPARARRGYHAKDSLATRRPAHRSRCT